MVNEKRVVYSYNDENHKLLFRKIRIEPGFDGRSKSFYYEREENGQIIKGLEGCRKVLYRLPELLCGISGQQTVFLVEGEKDVDTLLSHTLIASTAPITHEWLKEFTQMLNGADVVLLYDNDKAGLQRRDLVARSLYGNVKKLRVVDLPGIEYSEKHGKDISDWLMMGNTFGQLLDLVEEAPEYTPAIELEAEKQKTGLRIVSIEELFALELPPREMLLAPFLPSQGLALIVAKRGVGKTHVALGIAYAVATGGEFFCWKAPAPKKVLYIDGEMPASLMQERLQKLVAMSGKQPDKDFFKLITPDLQDKAMPDLSRQEGRDTIEEFLQDVDLVIIDNLSCLFRSGNENEAESWQGAQEWALDLRRRGKSVLFVHHAGKSGNQRGTSKKEDALDAVILLKQPDDYKPEQGAFFEVKFDKARHFSGEDARPFQVRLVEEEGLSRWEISSDPEEELLELVAAMKAEGKTIVEIMVKTKRTKSQVETLTIKAKERGLLVSL